MSTRIQIAKRKLVEIEGSLPQFRKDDLCYWCVTDREEIIVVHWRYSPAIYTYTKGGGAYESALKDFINAQECGYAEFTANKDSTIDRIKNICP